MVSIRDAFHDAWSDGSQISPTQPMKSTLRGLGDVIDAALSSVADGILVGGAISYATRSSLFADLAHPDGRMGVVYNDGTASYNGIYRKSGSSGSGSWVLTNLALPSTFVADLAGKASQAAVDTVQEQVLGISTDPFPSNRFGEIDVFRADDFPAPTNGVTITDASINIAASGRLYPRAAIANFKLSVGDTVRVAFQKLAGTAVPSALRFLNSSQALVTSVTFTLRGGWYIAEGVIPSSTTQLNVDFTNSSGGAVQISQMRIARAEPVRDGVQPTRARVDGVTSDAGDKGNIWPGPVSVGTTAGSGTAQINSDGTVTVPAGANVEIRPQDGLISRATTDIATILVKMSSAQTRSVRVQTIGAITSTALTDMRYLGDGWWLWSAALAVPGQAAIKGIYIVVDNRAPVTSIYTPADVIVEQVIIIDGANIPSRVPAPAPDNFPDDEMAITQSAGAIQIAQKTGVGGQYTRWTLSRYDIPAIRALGWRLTSLTKAVRTAEFAFNTGTVLTDGGEFEIAIKEVGKTDFMGGEAHGDMEEDRDVIVFVDGTRITPDGGTSYRARRIEIIQKASLWEVDNATRTLTATLITRWVFERGTLRLFHRLTWGRNLTITTPYLTMLPLLRGAGGKISGVAYRAPDYTPFSIAAAGHNMPKGNYQRLLTSGSGGIGVDVEIIKGWSASSTSFVEDTSTPARNKLYFSPYSIDGTTAVTTGSVIEWGAIYRVGLTQ